MIPLCTPLTQNVLYMECVFFNISFFGDMHVQLKWYELHCFYFLNQVKIFVVLLKIKISEHQDCRRKVLMGISNQKR